jgi:VanZ family protein
MYFILGFLVQIGDRRAYLFKLLIVFSLPFITEYAQNFIEMRRADPIDMYYDYLGLFVGFITVLVYKNVKKT